MSASVVSRAAGLGALTAAGQILMVGSLPLYSRVFDPSAYGEYVIFVGATGVVSVLAGLRYEGAIVLPRDDRLAAALSGLVMVIAVIVAGLITSAVLLAAAFNSGPDRLLHMERHFGLGLAAATAIGALQRCLTSWCVRSARFFRIGFGQFVLCLVSVVAQLSFTRLMDQLPALIWGYVCALMFQTACLSTLLPYRIAWVRTPSWRGMRVVARKYRRFPAYMVGYALASTLRDRLIQIMLGIGAGVAVVGRFGLAYRVAFAPNSLIYSAVSPIFFSIASRGNRLAVGRFAAAMVEAAFVILVVPFVAFAIEAPALTDGLLSGKWHGTGPYVQALAGPALLLAATCWLDRAFDSFRRQGVAFLLEVSFTVASVVLVACLSRFVDPVFVVWAFATLAIVYYWTYFLVTFDACGFPFADFRRACQTGALALGGALVFSALAHQLPGWGLRLSAYVLLTVTVLVFWIRFRDGAAILRLLMQSRVGDRTEGLQPPHSG